MATRDDIKPISYIKTHAAAILEQINTTHQPIIITQNGEAKGVFIDTESFDNMNKTLGLLKILSQSEKEIANKKTSSQKDVFSKLNKKLKKCP